MQGSKQPVEMHPLQTNFWADNLQIELDSASAIVSNQGGRAITDNKHVACFFDWLDKALLFLWSCQAGGFRQGSRILWFPNEIMKNQRNYIYFRHGPLRQVKPLNHM